MNEGKKQPGQNPLPQPTQPVQVVVAGILNDDATNNPVVVLQSKENERVLLMWIGDTEAEAIDSIMQNTATTRPLTHRLLLNTIATLGGALTHVVIDRLKQGTYYASLYIRTKSNIHLIDARPSDAIALALLAQCPLLVDRTLFQKSSTTLKVEQVAAPQARLDISVEFVPRPQVATQPQRGIPPPPPAPMINLDTQEEAKSSAQFSALLPRPHQPVEKHELSAEDIERIRKQLTVARTLEEGN